MADGLAEELGDVVVVEVIDDPAPLPLAEDEPQVAEDSKLMGDGGGLHLDRGRELVDACRTVPQATEDAHPARRRERLHGIGDGRGE